jgi:hypothetical protein
MVLLGGFKGRKTPSVPYEFRPCERMTLSPSLSQVRRLDLGNPGNGVDFLASPPVPESWRRLAQYRKRPLFDRHFTMPLPRIRSCEAGVELTCPVEAATHSKRPEELRLDGIKSVGV